MFRTEESHSKEHKVAVDDLFLTSRTHLRATSIWSSYPLNFFYFGTLHITFTVVYEAIRRKTPTTLAPFLMAGCGFENNGPPRPWSIWVMTYRWLRHNLNLSHTLGSLTMSSSYTVATRITTTDDEDFLSLSRNAWFVTDIFTRKQTVLLTENLESEIYAVQFTTRNFQVAGGRGTCSDDYSIEIRITRSTIPAIRAQLGSLLC